MRSLIIYFLTIIGNIACLEEKFDPLIVHTKNGVVKGRVDFTVGQHKPYYVFQGIPYAQPPVGNLRFEPPIPTENWKGILNATEYRGDCVQIDTILKGTEDCLHLNIYKPKISYQSRIPVMVWIYGGGFQTGSSSKEFYGPDYFIDQNVIIVTLNYRLNIFGFLSTMDLVVPGNNALKDQALALLWIKENIRSFGGDPWKITLFGNSAGATSVSYHLTQPKTKGLYRNAIIQSGNSLCLWSLSRQMDKGLARLFELYNATSTQDLVDKLRAASIETISNQALQITTEYLKDYTKGFVFGPIIEPEHSGAFITGKTHELLVKKKFNPVPVIMGTMSFEALTFIFEFIRFIADNEVDVVPVDLNLVSQDERNAVKAAIENYYFNNQPINNQLYEVLQFYTDHIFVRPIRELALLMSRDVPVYFYVFSYMGNLGIIPNDQRPFPGLGHAEELGYMWRKDSNETTNKDALVRSRIVKLWTNFAKYNNPTLLLDPELDYFLWPQVKTLSRNLIYVNITENFDINLNPRKNNMLLWDEIYSEYGHSPFDTY